MLALVPALLAVFFSLPTGAPVVPRVAARESCVATGGVVHATLRGFPSPQAVVVQIRGRSTAVLTDARGVAAVALRAPRRTRYAPRAPFRVERLVLRAAQGSNVATAHVLLAQPRIAVSPARGRAAHAVRLRGLGLRPGRPVYAHAGRRTRLVARAGQCGAFTARARVFAALPAGPAVVRLDDRRRASRRTRPQAVVRVRVAADRRTYRVTGVAVRR